MLDPRNLPKMPELMIAGPGEMHEEDLVVAGRQLVAHYGELWKSYHDHVCDLVGQAVGSAERPYVIPGSGTLGLDVAIGNMFEGGQRVVMADTGFFGTRLIEVAKAHRLDVVEIPVEIGEPFDVARIADAAEGADGIASVHVETGTGVRHPVEEVAALARERGLPYVVDAIASVGAERIGVDDLGLAALVTGGQKGLEGPTGLAIVALGEAGRERMSSRSRGPASWYCDLATWDWYRREWGTWHPHPITMPTPLILALGASVQRILDVGMAEWVARKADLAKRLREGLRSLGLEPIPRAGVESNLVVANWADDAVAIQKHLLEVEGIQISGGLAATQGKAIRIGLMGRTASEEMIDRVLAGVSRALAGN